MAAASKDVTEPFSFLKPHLPGRMVGLSFEPALSETTFFPYPTPLCLLSQQHPGNGSHSELPVHASKCANHWFFPICARRHRMGQSSIRLPWALVLHAFFVLLPIFTAVSGQPSVRWFQNIPKFGALIHPPPSYHFSSFFPLLSTVRCKIMRL